MKYMSFFIRLDSAVAQLIRVVAILAIKIIFHLLICERSLVNENIRKIKFIMCLLNGVHSHPPSFFIPV